LTKYQKNITNKKVALSKIPRILYFLEFSQFPRIFYTFKNFLYLQKRSQTFQRIHTLISQTVECFSKNQLSNAIHSRLSLVLTLYLYETYTYRNCLSSMETRYAIVVPIMGEDECAEQYLKY